MGTIHARGATTIDGGILGARLARFGSWLIESLAAYGSSEVGVPPAGDALPFSWAEPAAYGANTGTPRVPRPRRTAQQMRYRSASWRHPYRRN